MTATSSPTAFRNALTGVLAATLVAGCASAIAAPKFDAAKVVKQAQSLVAKGQPGKAIPLLEAAVAADPNNAALRGQLGHAYLKAGRFDSAASALGDAMTLGDNTARTALALALSQAAAGRSQAAVGLLDDWRDTIPASDLGLALALSGEPARGAAILADALRSGDNTPKLRQNLAYAYALDGRWREARIMVQADVPAGEVDARLTQWAASGKAEDYQARVAALLGVAPAADAGMPAALALNASPAVEQFAAETAAVPAPAAELPAVAAAAELPPVAEAPVVAVAYAPPAEAVAEPMPVAMPVQVAVERVGNVEFFSSPIVQPVPVAALAAFVPQPRAVRARAAGVTVGRASGSHLVQLGSFSSPQGARRAWGIFAAKTPALRGYKMTITQAHVRGKNYWRVAAAGFDGASANGLCANLKRRGGACFAYAPARAVVPGKAPGRAVGPAFARR
ncbi:MAG: tetratricopeptide repeat protein [Novosphingobium sp.]